MIEDLRLRLVCSTSVFI